MDLERGRISNDADIILVSGREEKTNLQGEAVKLLSNPHKLRVVIERLRL